MLAVRTTRLGKEDVIQSTPSLLRYVGREVDIAKSLKTQCGIMKLSALDEKSARIFDMLSQRVSPYGSGFRLTP